MDFRYFRIEEKDMTPRRSRSGILAPAAVFFATIDDECIGCCALFRLSADSSRLRRYVPRWGSGIGHRLLRRWWRRRRPARAGSPRNESHFAPAIRLYRSIGFSIPANIGYHPRTRGRSLYGNGSAGGLGFRTLRPSRSAGDSGVSVRRFVPTMVVCRSPPARTFCHRQELRPRTQPGFWNHRFAIAGPVEYVKIEPRPAVCQPLPSAWPQASRTVSPWWRQVTFVRCIHS